ncbi:hypothetical protein Ancab_023955 [Ancistrocladus abbreviatus]
MSLMLFRQSVLALVASSMVKTSINQSLNVPIYYFFTSCASVLASILYLPTLHNRTSESFKDLSDILLHLPGLPPLRASHLPEPLLDLGHVFYDYFLNFASCLQKSNGILINTCNSLQARAIESIRDGTCIPNAATPPIYCIEPITAAANERGITKLDSSSTISCMSWLDKQPSRTVVFLCFGSKGAFLAAQLNEIALGLENRFLERTKERGLVVKSWVPQAEILRHEAVGGFVTHCGWNSILEAVVGGVPMLCWPLYAEQHLNSVVLVQEMKVAVGMEKRTHKTSLALEGLVTGDEVERGVRRLMGLEEGEALRERSLKLKAAVMSAWKDGGSSRLEFLDMLSSWRRQFAGEEHRR